MLFFYYYYFFFFGSLVGFIQDPTPNATIALLISHLLTGSSRAVSFSFSFSLFFIRFYSIRSFIFIIIIFFFFQKRCGRSESPTGTKEATAVTNHPQSIVVPAVVISLKTHRRRRMKSETVSSLIFHVWAFFFFYHRDFFGVGK